jgi:hypothetical protein
MSTTTVNGVERFRSKDTTRPFTEAPTHGSVSWTFVDGQWLGWHYWSLPPDQSEWISIDEFSRRTKERKDRNYQYYKSHPNALREKIGQYKGRDRRSRSSWEFLSGGWGGTNGL